MIRLTALTLLLCAATMAQAETTAKPTVDPHAGHQMMGMEASGDESPSTLAYMKANTAMHEGMAIAFTGDADVDFITGMIPHHQGAVDMARIVLEHGKDPEVRKLAEGVIVAQEAEIAWMRDWLAKNGQ